MSQFSESSVKAFPATAAGVRGTAVKLSGGVIVVATAGTDVILGVLDVDHDAGQQANVRLRSASGTAVGRAGGNIAVGDKVTATTGGELIATTTEGEEIVGIALEAAADDGLFEFMPSTGEVTPAAA
jgi:hypothetical protein